jgi:hypothetical protein
MPKSRRSGPALQVLQTARKNFESKLSGLHVKDFSQTTLEDARQGVLETEAQMAARGCLRNTRRLMPLFEGLHHYSKAVEVLCNGVPFMPLIWAPIKFIVNVSLVLRAILVTSGLALRHRALNLDCLRRSLARTSKHSTKSLANIPASARLSSGSNSSRIPSWTSRSSSRSLWYSTPTFLNSTGKHTSLSREAVCQCSYLRIRQANSQQPGNSSFSRPGGASSDGSSPSWKT